MPTYDLLITGGTLVDPGQNLHDRRDVAFKDGMVAAVEPAIPRDEATTTIDATGNLVTPGLIDAHVHIFEGVSHYGINPDQTCLAHGATTVIDAGSAGGDTFTGFRKYVIDTSATRIFAHVNISSMGMLAKDIGELDDIKWASVPKALETIERNRDVVLGVKVRLTRHELVSEASGLKPLFLAREAADAAGLPIMVHPQRAWCESIDQILEVMRGGDVLTHMYHGMEHGIFGDDGQIRPSVRAARDRGVIFDVGHGQGSFNWEICERALAQDFPPDTISSDLHRWNVDGPVFNLATTVSKFLHLGLTLDDALARTTIAPARLTGLTGLTGHIGTLAPGAHGDAVVFDLQEGAFPLIDSHDVTRTGSLNLLPVAVVKAGQEYIRANG